ncbi:MAG: radical SAM protein [Spirochaetaceae bacterium]|jgi:MoaA/NifB/PqqE/SkfB family radical SAM enzyme|nr:radical SAM protein [Spirochaetaceae bacterium]
MKQNSITFNFDEVLRGIRNNIVKIIPENSMLFKWLSIAGLKMNAQKHHVPLTSLVMGVYATEHCNLNCKCCTAFSPIAEETFLHIASYKKDMKKLAELTAGKLASFYVTGGEPLLHPQIAEVFGIAREYFPETEISFMTNGLLLLKMPETFWEKCREYSVAINISRYPINIDIEAIRNKAQMYQIKFDYVGGTGVPIKSMWKYPLDTEGKQSLRRSYGICSQINRCVTMKDGKIYPCNTIAGIGHFNKYFNKDLKVTADDVLELHNVKNIHEVYNFLYTPKPFCKYCNRKGVEFGITYGNSKKEISEWT